MLSSPRHPAHPQALTWQDVERAFREKNLIWEVSLSQDQPPSLRLVMVITIHRNQPNPDNPSLEIGYHPEKSNWRVPQSPDVDPLYRGLQTGPASWFGIVPNHNGEWENRFLLSGEHL